MRDRAQGWRNLVATIEREVGSEPTSPPVPAEPAEQKYHHEDDQKRIRIHGRIPLKASAARRSSILAAAGTGSPVAGRLTPRQNSENTHLGQRRIGRRPSLSVERHVDAASALVGDAAFAGFRSPLPLTGPRAMDVLINAKKSADPASPEARDAAERNGLE